jgi:flagellar biosynthetic protein FliR
LSLPSFDLFAPGSAAVAVLLATRLSGLVLIAPVFSAKLVPMTVRTGLLLVLTVALQPVAYADAFRSGAMPAITATSLAGEAIVGFAIGIGAALLVGAAEAAGELMGTQMGLSGAALFDPLNNSQVPALGQFMQLFAVTLLLSVDGHILMLQALAASLHAAPVGAPLELGRGLSAILSLGGTLFLLGLRFAAPVIAAVLVANVALAVLSRAAPQLNILSVAFPVQIGIGLFALAGALTLIGVFFAGWSGFYDGMLTHVLRPMLGLGGGSAAPALGGR